jgi:two-component system phosphate regulon sensor histidine kinase PhoR
MLFQSTRGFKNGEASARLTSGLKLLSVVLPLTEAVVFQRDKTLDFVPVARLKGETSSVDDSTRNSVWRGGLKLCERAFRSRDLVIDNSNQVGPTVAVPLEYQQEITGVLLVRLRAELCKDDRSLLNAVGAQFARNLARDTVAKAPLRNSFLSFFSAQTGEKKIEAMDVVRAGVIEQQCEGNALTQIHEGVAIAYLDGTLALMNRSMQSFAGVTPEHSEKLDLFALLDRFRTDVFDEPAIAIRRVLQTGEAYEGELSFDERDQILGLRISLLLRDALEPVGIAIFVRDLTSLKEYEKLKSDMISLMSHELRTPLTSINGFAEVLSADDTIPESAKEFVTIIANESQRMSRMINTFLSVTQLQRKDKQEVLKIPLRLDEVVRDTISSLQPVAKKKRIRLVEQQPHRIPPVAADKSLITQAVKNLLHNAIKYSPERTTVTVSTALEAETVRVSVEDRGFGIPAESRDRVWEKFYRVVREGQEKDEESTGLGLAFVREVIEQHGGSVGVDSEEGRGSKFSFTLPRL